ncbi:MAG: YbhB/YbcL family Raf kinase inhibitor-like protein [Clostridiales bacterium]|nr:YbhB/YbcL family Raf kinase inhibitor-like protein [Clostridiales bacterium]
MEEGELDFICSGINADGKFERENTGRGEDLSPEFYFGNLSPYAKSLIITLEDLSLPVKNYTHWVIWNIPPTDFLQKGIAHGKYVADLGGAVQGIGYGIHRYAGPKPPRGKSHKYRFTVYALDSMLDLKPSATKRKVLKAAMPHVIQQGEAYGYYE